MHSHYTQSFFDIIQDFIRINFKTRKTFNTSTTSYGLKHRCEKWLSELPLNITPYIDNDTFNEQMEKAWIISKKVEKTTDWYNYIYKATCTY